MGFFFLNDPSVFRWSLVYNPCISPPLKSCKRSHNGCCVFCWGCSWLSGPSGCFAGETLRSSVGTAAGYWVWDICVMHSMLQGQHWSALWQALKEVCRKACIFVPKSALQCRVVHQLSPRGGNVHGEAGRINRYPSLWMSLHEGLK